MGGFIFDQRLFFKRKNSIKKWFWKILEKFWKILNKNQKNFWKISKNFDLKKIVAWSTHCAMLAIIINPIVECLLFQRLSADVFNGRKVANINWINSPLLCALKNNTFFPQLELFPKKNPKLKKILKKLKKNSFWNFLRIFRNFSKYWTFFTDPLITPLSIHYFPNFSKENSVWIFCDCFVTWHIFS